MNTIFQYDENFIYVIGGDLKITEDEEIPSGYTDVPPEEGLYKAKFDPKKKMWFESASKEYIESLQPKPQPSEMEIMQKEIAELYYLLAVGGEAS